VPTVEILLELAAERQRLGQHDGALAALSAGIALDPSVASLHLMRGLVLKSLKSAHAGTGPRRSVAIAPNDSRAHVELALAEEAAERPWRAGTSFRRAAVLSPSHAETWVGLGRCAHAKDQPQRALLYRQRALCIDSKTDTGPLQAIALIASGRWREAVSLLEADTYRRRGPDARIVAETTAAKLQHDAEQFEHLIGLGRLPGFLAETAADYRRVAATLPRDGNPTTVLHGEARQKLAATYNRLLYRDPAAGVQGPALNPRLDADAITRTYHESRPQLVVIDEFLTQEALATVLRFCRDSTVWFTGNYSGGYVGAHVADGFTAPVLFQIAEELKAFLPGVIGDAGLHHLWAFKYDSRLTGIALHADAARINVNFWVTPDEANLNPDSGGLEVFDEAAPADWKFASFNGDLAAIQEHLKRTGSRSVVVPHRQNRAVLFHSDLFHRTDDIHFREGYLNRRINVTMLYGVRPVSKA